MSVLELNSREVTDPSDGCSLMVTPPISEEFWLARVRVGKDGQALVCFPKFNTVGIGFAREEDWNTNLPYTCPAEEILAHIEHNKGEEIPDPECLVAIRQLQGFAAGFIETRR